MIVFLPNCFFDMKKLMIFLCEMVSLCIPFTTMAQVGFEPIYASERFQPTDAFHATCENQLNVIFSLENTKITWISAILDYNPNDIEILRIIWENEKEANLSYVVNDNKIYLNKLKSEGNVDGWSNMVVFDLYLKSKENVSDTKISFADGSYIVDSDGNMINISDSIVLQFVSVPECEPDIVSPKVNLLFPKENARVPLDTYFQFDISDLWKWINEDSIVLSVNGIDYDINSLEHEWEMNILTIYPDFWMPFNTGFEVKLSVSDKQVYWWANSITKVYNLETMSEMYLLNKITPEEFRKIVNSQKYYKWTEQECEFLAYNYSLAQHDWDSQQQTVILSINHRLSCPDIESSADDLILDEFNWISLLSVLGWTMFVCSFLIILMQCARRTKK